MSVRSFWFRPISALFLLAAGAGCEFVSDSKTNYAEAGASATGSTGSTGTGAGGGGAGEKDAGPSNLWVDLYYPGWRASRLPPEALDLSGVTHVIHFAWLPWIPEGGTELVIDEQLNSVGEEAAKALISTVHAAGKKVLISVGGSGRGSQYFNQAMSDASRAWFIQAIITKTVERGYDGIDIDWEPGWDNTQRAIPLFQTFSRELGAAVKSIAPHLILTTAGLGASSNVFGGVADVYDQINIMTYDLVYGVPQTWHNSAIGGGSGAFYSIDRSGTEYVGAGVPKHKVGIGLKCAGYSWEGTTMPRETPVGSPRSIAYTSIMTNHYSEAVYKWDELGQVPYLSITTPSPVFITYDDARSAKAKVDFLRNARYGGLIIWDSSEQYFAMGDATGEKNPLLTAVKQAIAGN
jgi:chitinase